MKHALHVIRHYHSALGFRGVIAFLSARLTGRHPLLETKVAGIRHPVFVRIGTTDTTVLRQVLLEKHYDMALPITPKVIVDAGANIGLSAVFFANRYPEAAIIAIEPEATNFQLLQKNVAPYPQIITLQAALWKEKGQISLVDPHYGHHGFQIMEAPVNGGEEAGLVQAITMEDVFLRAGSDTVDFLKIDIEGAEREVFENSAKWMDKVGLIMAELHDSIKPGCQQAFFDATQSFSKTFHKGETVCRLREKVGVYSEGGMM